MLFNSYVFIFAFLPITALGFAMLGRQGLNRIAVFWLVVCSAFYYGYFSWQYLQLLCISLTVNYLIANVWLAAKSPSLRRAGLIFGLTFNLAALAYFKYTNLIITGFDTLTGSAVRTRNIMLPLGISFFTFQKIAYLIDTYKGRGYSRNFLNYCLFVLFFPQLIAGPIVHPREVLPQFSRKRGFGITAKNLGIGLTLFTIGLTKKVLLADTVAPSASRVFDEAAAGIMPGFTTAWLGALAYAVQIYFDFSGYTDMAIGLARIFGVRLPINFNSPYQALNISDFWRRWHITLSRFLRDYLYIPLGGNRKGPARRYVNLMLTMLLGGLWHGASLTFVFWGGLHGMYLVIHQIWARRVDNARSTPATRWQRAWPRALTFIAVVFAWVYFRAADFPAANRVVAGMLGLNGSDLPQISRDAARWFAVVSLLAIGFFAPNSQHLMALSRPALGILPPLPSQRPGRILWHPEPAWAVLIAVAFVACVLELSRASEFIYYQF